MLDTGYPEKYFPRVSKKSEAAVARHHKLAAEEEAVTYTKAPESQEARQCVASARIHACIQLLSGSNRK